MADRIPLALRAGIVTLGTLASRVLGLARDMVITGVFSVAIVDAFVVAFTIPNALRGLLAEGAVASAFVPTHATTTAQEGTPAARLYFARFLGSMAVILAMVTVLGVAFAEPIVELYAGHAQPETRALTAELTRWMFPYIFFMGVSALLSGALNAAHHYATPAFAPALLNVAVIAVAATLVPWFEARGENPALALAVGVLLGGALQATVQLPALRRSGFPLRPRIAFGDPRVRASFALMAPLVVGLGMYQVNVLLSRRFASGLDEGAQSYLYLAQRLVELPQGLFAFAVATASLPALSALAAEGQHGALSTLFSRSMRLSMFVAVPSTVFLGVMAEPTVTVLFGRGAFGPSEVTQTALALVCLAPSIWAVSAVRTMVPLYYAHGLSKIPVVASGVNLVVFVAAAWWLMGPFGLAGIALANTLASAAQLVTLLAFMDVRLPRVTVPGFALAFGKTLVACLAMAGVLVALRFTWPTASAPRVVELVAGVTLGGGVFLVAQWFLRSEELRDAVRAVQRKLGRPRVEAP